MICRCVTESPLPGWIVFRRSTDNAGNRWTDYQICPDCRGSMVAQCCDAHPPPAYWMYETSGVLRPAVEAFVRGEPLPPTHIAVMRAYLRQWIMAPVWQGEGVEQLRTEIDGLTSREAIARWINTAIEEGLDPL